MAITKPFGGSVLRHPGAYSQTVVSQNGGAPLAGNSTLLIVGEAETGAPGDVVGYQSFSSAQLPQLVAQYTSGPIVDMARAAVQAPSKTPGVGGADQIIVWKTNSSTLASLTLKNGSAANLLIVSAANYGAPGNKIAVSIQDGSTGQQKNVIVQSPSLTENLGQNAGLAQLSIHYIGSGTPATLSIAGASEQAKTLTTSCTGATADNLSIPLAGLSMKDLVAQISNFAGGTKYSCSLLSIQLGSITPATDLDLVSAVDILTSPVSLYRLQHEILDLINQNSTQVTAALAATPVSGLPADIALTNLSGGALGPSVNSDFAAGFNNSLSQTWNVGIPGISQDATADIALGVTDPSSTYTIASVQAAFLSHLELRGNIKNRKEAQGMVGFRVNTAAAAYAQAQALGSELIQLAIEDVLVVDQNGNLNWKQPHVFAALCAGIRLGTDVGEPLTFKFLNISGMGQDVNPLTGIVAGDFDPQTDFDPAIDAGVLFAEPAQGGFRIVVDNTTYGVDQSFVFNRGSVVEAAQYIAQQVRTTLENTFVGKKISAGTAKSILSIMFAELDQLRDAQIITPTDAFPLGYDKANAIVTIDGNTANVSILVIPVQGLDFVLITFTLGNIIQSA